MTITKLEKDYEKLTKLYNSILEKPTLDNKLETDLKNKQSGNVTVNVSYYYSYN